MMALNDKGERLERNREAKDRLGALRCGSDGCYGCLELDAVLLLIASVIPCGKELVGNRPSNLHVGKTSSDRRSLR
jgi:hypothetical protein